MTVRYEDVIGPLRTAYDARAAWRDGRTKEPWKLAERQAFRDRLAPGARLLEIGAGTGQDCTYFRDEGLAVVATDLSPVMVGHCRAKGIEAHVMDFLHLDFPAGSFDAVYALNCLLHVPNRDLPAVLDAIRAVLRPGGLLFVGVYGGRGSAEGPIDGDEHVPPRFFSWRTDEQLLVGAPPGGSPSSTSTPSRPAPTVSSPSRWRTRSRSDRHRNRCRCRQDLGLRG